jgi:hypothetical protein
MTRLGFAMRFLFAVLASFALAAPACARDCPFAYNTYMKHRVVLPALVSAGESDSVFDTRDPFVSHEDDGTILLILHFRERAMDAPDFRITLDPCTLKVLKASRGGGMVASPGRDAVASRLRRHHAVLVLETRAPRRRHPGLH